MPLLDGTVDRLIMEERRNIQKYLAGQIPLDIEFDEKDDKLVMNMDGEIVWLKRLQSKKILA